MRVACLVAFLAFTAHAQTPPAEAPHIGQISKDSVWVPTPERMIHRMLQIADTTKDDVILDLGSGDGRIPIYASKHFGARSIGVELEGNLVKLSRETAAAQGVADLARFVQQDLYETDLSKATVIALYISPDVMRRLTPRFFALQPGTRIVSHQFQLEDWEPDEWIFAEGRNGYLWIVPAQVRGDWTLHVAGDAGDTFWLRVEQVRQRLRTSGERAGNAISVIGARLRGTEISFTAFDPDGSARQYQGHIEGDRMRGNSGGYGLAPRAWSAMRR